MSTPRKSRKRAPTDAGTAPAPAVQNRPPLTDEQLRVLHQVYTIILAHSSPAGSR